MLQCGVLFVTGAWLFGAPTAVGWWPWTLTPLVAQAMAAWLLGLAVVIATAVWENDLDRIRIATISAVVLGGLQLIAAARYRNDFRGGVSLPLYLGFLVLLMVDGVVEVVARRVRSG